MAPRSPEDENVFPAETEALLSELRRSAERKARLNRCFRPFSYLSAVYYLVYGLFVTLLHVSVPTAFAPLLAVTFNIASGILISSVMLDFVLWKYIEKSRNRFQRLINGVGEDPKTIGSLAQLCNNTHLFSMSDLAIEPLLKILPRLQAGDARFISDNQMEALLGLLNMNVGSRLDKSYHALTRAILKALEQIGDSRAIEPVRRLTKGRLNRPYHQAAQECLAVLEQHAVEMDYNRTLLLPASTETGQETLLRATIPPIDAQPELLLRAATEKEYR